MMLADIVSSIKKVKRWEKIGFECGVGGRGDGRDWAIEIGVTGVIRWEILTKWENLFKEETRRFTVATGKVAIK